MDWTFVGGLDAGGGFAVTALFLSSMRPAGTLLATLASASVAAGAVALAALACGEAAIALTRRAATAVTGAADGGERPAVRDAVTVGFPLLGTFVAILAALGVWLHLLVGLTVIGGSAAGALALWRRRGAMRIRWPGGSASLLLVVPLIVAVIGAVTPVNSPDELVYKLAVPRAYAHEGRMFEMPLNSNSYLVLALHFTDMAALVLDGGVAAKLARLALFLAALAIVHRTSRRWLTGEHAGWLTAAVAFTPALMQTSGWCWNEWGVLALLIASYEHYERTLEKRSPLSLAICGLALGGAAASKYSALPWLLAFAILILIRHRSGAPAGVRGGEAAGGPLSRPDVALLGGVTVLAGAFFYVRNLVWTGSPLAPLFLPNAPRVANYRGGEWYSGWIDFLSGRDLADRQVLDESLGPLLMAGVVFGLLALRSKRRELRDLALIGVIQMPLLLTFAPGSRNMLNGVAPLAIAGLALLLALPGVVFRLLALVAMAAQTLVVLFVFETYEVGRYLAGKESAAAYLARLRPFVAPYAWIGAATPRESRVLLLGENRPYYLPRQWIAGGNHDGPRLAAWLAQVSTPEAMHAEWRRLGVTHILLHKPWYRVRRPGQRPLSPTEHEYVLEVPPQVDAVVTQMLKTRAILRYRDRDYLVFELRR